MTLHSLYSSLSVFKLDFSCWLTVFICGKTMVVSCGSILLRHQVLALLQDKLTIYRENSKEIIWRTVLGIIRHFLCKDTYIVALQTSCRSDPKHFMNTGVKHLRNAVISCLAVWSVKWGLCIHLSTSSDTAAVLVGYDTVYCDIVYSTSNLKFKVHILNGVLMWDVCKYFLNSVTCICLRQCI